MLDKISAAVTMPMAAKTAYTHIGEGANKAINMDNADRHTLISKTNLCP